MSILIRDAEMPKETTAFVFSKNGKVSRFSVGASKDRMFEAVEIQTPHGRLIDADALMKEIHETCKRLYGTDDINTASPTLSAFKLYIGEAPTVIEAEEET